ncbi:MAG: glycosyltransferase [Acidimicrobiales bacterium]
MTTVLHFVESWLPLSAGFVSDHIRTSAHAGVVLTRGREGDSGPGSWSDPGVRVWNLAPVIRVAGRVGGRAEAKAVSAAVAAVALVHRVEVVHAHFGYRLRDVSGACRRLGLPLVVSLHGHDVTAFVRAHPHHYDGMWDRVAAVIVPSRFLARTVIELGAPASTVEIVPAGVDTSWWAPTAPPKGQPTVLFVGRLVEKKGVDTLLAAWPEVSRRAPDARLRVLGDGPLSERVRGQNVELMLPDRARPREQVRAAIADATLVVSPSRTAGDGDAESLLLVNLEAQACGRPVVSTRHGGIPEFVDDGRTGLLVGPDDPAALADAVTRLLCDRDLAFRLGAAGPAWAARFDSRASTARVDAVYERLAEGSHHRRWPGRRPASRRGRRPHPDAAGGP